MKDLKELEFTTTNGVKTMSSIQLAELCIGKDKFDHTNFIKKMKKVLGESAVVKFYNRETYGNNNTRSVYNLPEREACLMAMSYSYELQAYVYDAWKAAEKEVQYYKDFYIARQEKLLGMNWDEACAYAGIKHANYCRMMLLNYSGKPFTYFTKNSSGGYYVTEEGVATGYFYNRGNKFTKNTTMKISKEGRDWLKRNRDWFNTQTDLYIEKMKAAA